MFPEAEPRETLRFEGNKMNCFPRDQSLSDLLYLPTPNRTNCEKFPQLCTNFTQICRGFKVHDQITCESKVQVVVSLGS